MQCERRMGQKLHSQGSLMAAFILTSHTLCLCFTQCEQKRVKFPSQGTGLPSSVSRVFQLGSFVGQTRNSGDHRQDFVTDQKFRVGRPGKAVCRTRIQILKEKCILRIPLSSDFLQITVYCFYIITTFST